MSLRSHLADQLRKDLPRAWSVKPYRYSLDTIKNPVVMLATVGFEKTVGRTGRLPSMHDHDITVTVFVPEIAPERRYDAIEAAADRLVTALEKVQARGEFVRWDRTTFDVDDNYPSADITITVTTAHQYAGPPAS